MMRLEENSDIRGNHRSTTSDMGGTIHCTFADCEMTPVRLSPKVELAIVGGLGMLVLAAPAIVEFIKDKAQIVRARLIILGKGIRQADISKKLTTLNRRRKNGSLIRVIGSVLPDSMFTPPCRIYIPKWAQLASTQWNINPYVEGVLLDMKSPDLPSENDVGDGLIEAFEIGSEVISSVSGADDDDEDDDVASSAPEGWTEEQRMMANFNPTMNVTNNSSFARCSTPKANKGGIHLNITQDPYQNTSRMREEHNQTEISELKKMVESLMLLNLETTRQLSELQQQMPKAPAISVTQSVEDVSPPKLILPLNEAKPSIVVAIPNLNASTAASSVPPPPPPPPPPMPSLPLETNRKLVITKKGDQAKLIEKKPQVSLSDVLKELPNAKLRRVERSPGGTPIKPQLKLANEGASLDIGSQLAFALKKRYESMHSPACETDTDKENNYGSSGDSFEDENESPIPAAKRALFPPLVASPRRKSRGSQENSIPVFGQHLLKKRNMKENGNNVSPLAVSPFREQN